MNVISGAIERSKTTLKQTFVGFFEAFKTEGIAYCGYPLLDTSNGAIPVDGLLLSQEHIPVIFTFYSAQTIQNLEKVIEAQDTIHSALHSRLLKHSTLRERRDLKFKIEVVTFAPFLANKQGDETHNIFTQEGLIPFLKKCKTDIFNRDTDTFRNLTSVVQAFDKRAPATRKIPSDESKKYARHLAFVDSQTGQLDVHQNRAIVETTDGPQRIRGLAGSGKTVVLASKAAYLHASDGDLDIILTFYTKALYGFLRQEVRKYYRLYTNSLEEPNWEKLRIMHAWGNKSLPGVYREISTKYDRKYYDFMDAINQFGYDAPFKGICDILNPQVDGSIQIADVVIIDEAQDLPVSFFETVYKITRPPKRIVWAYDELQKLDSIETVPPANILFGKNNRGQPNVQLTNKNQDIVLPICYRNPKEVLTTAHAFGFGVYRREYLIQMIEDESLWSDIGYELTGGKFSAGSDVVLQRTNKSSPDFMSEQNQFSEPIVLKKFDSDLLQADWIASEINRLIKTEQLLPTDIAVVHPDARTAKSGFKPLQKALAKFGIAHHVVGSGFSDEFFIEDSVCLTHIFRAKGNETAYVFVIEAQYCASGRELIKRRNALFTAITRSRAWVAVCGWGSEFDTLLEEYEAVKEAKFTLSFKWPSVAALEQMRRLHRELSEEEKRARKTAERNAQDLMNLFASGRLEADDLDPELRENLKKWLK